MIGAGGRRWVDGGTVEHRRGAGIMGAAWRPEIRTTELDPAGAPATAIRTAAPHADLPIRPIRERDRDEAGSVLANPSEAGTVNSLVMDATPTARHACGLSGRVSAGAGPGDDPPGPVRGPRSVGGPGSGL